MKNKMKKMALAITLTLIFPIHTLASEGDASVSTQAPQQEGSISIIPVIGGNSMNISGMKKNDDLPENGNAKSGGMFGVLAGYKLGFLESTLEAGVMYMESGTQLGNSFIGIEYKLSYLSVPINWRVPIFTVGQSRFHAKTGVIPSYLMDAEGKGVGLLDGYATETSKDDFNSFDVIAHVGLGLSYPIYEQFDLQADISYLRGLQEVTKDGGGHNQGLSLALALAISI